MTVKAERSDGEMLFIVTQADYYKKFEDYGLKTMAITYNDVILTDVEEIEESEEVSYRFSEIEINTIEELLKFNKKCGCPLIIDRYKSFFTADGKKYDYEIKLYNDYLE